MTEILAHVRENPILALIIGCEIGFWFFLLAGLVARYPLRSPKVGAALLICTPLVDVVLLIATVFDLRAGGEATWPHAAAAIYLGLTLGFGHGIMRWADQRFHHRFAGGPPPLAPPKYGRPKVLHEWKQFGKFGLAWLISTVIMAALVFFVSTPAQTELLWKIAIPVMTGVGAAWFVFGPLVTTIRPPRPRAGFHKTYIG
ncbi:hypothetical protein [Lentzea cavernae]|uniref:Integral membrane protein n=1 Tax=Lentzea cavernae TaxID=2020703 RepID=A0ABQ3MBX2_9PSEU|nr:hypothetical protein [Lentzea cavernae]GHH38931.1 hypothetical protein GCM10017774_29640 [Lentzea cavernae]